MISGLLQVSGILVLRLVYGKRYYEKHSKKFGLARLLSIVNIFWLLSILFLIVGISAKDTALCLVLAVGYPLIIVIWALIERKMH